MSTLVTNLVSYWKLDEASGNVADYKGSNTLVNTGVVFAAGKIANGADFERGDTTDNLKITDAAQTGLDITGDIAISAWVKPESAPGVGVYYMIANKFIGTGDQRSYFFAYQNNGGTLRIMFSPGSGAASEILSKDVDLGTGTWKHIVMSWVAATSTVTFYVNGSSIGTATGAITSLYSGTADFIVGSSPDNDSFDGMIDEVMLWSRVLTSDEVTALYNGGNGLVPIVITDTVTPADNMSGNPAGLYPVPTITETTTATDIASQRYEWVNEAKSTAPTWTNETKH